MWERGWPLGFLHGAGLISGLISGLGFGLISGLGFGPVSGPAVVKPGQNMREKYYV
ncbi:MAG: hypothetical protein OIF56_03100 [Cohaesibacter sp.]|nr:hypothetical protein [Cohaesibacter sp.]